MNKIDNQKKGNTVLFQTILLESVVKVPLEFKLRVSPGLAENWLQITIKQKLLVPS